MTSPLAQQKWDVIVIGTGIGGGTIGRALAEAGLKVLFVEQGPKGHRAEAQGLNPEMWDDAARRVRGYWPGPIHARINGRGSRFLGPLGAGVGGSSVFYAATLEAPEPHDLDHSAARPHPTGGWPTSFAEMAPFIDAARDWYHISGTPDPLSTAPDPKLRPAPAPSAADAALLEEFAASGLHPYRLHAALRHVEGCQSCLGRKCPLPCKMDGRSAGVEPALATGHAALLDQAEVLSIGGTGRDVSHLNVRQNGETFQLSARRYVLAGGALGSPRLLLGSASEAWPQGCGNSSGLVGRNLMFHLNEMLAIWPRANLPAGGPSKGVSLRDLYWQDGQRFGMVQALGVTANYGDIVHFLNGMYDRSRLGKWRAPRHLTRLPAAIAARLLGQAHVFVGLMEDLPYAENRVLAPDLADPCAIGLRYDLNAELLARRRAFRKAMKRAFARHRNLFLTQTPELNFGHPCGTLRYGPDPRHSVLDPACRSHDLRNLYAVDAAFMPTSMGVNPSLTIAANALRVARHLIGDLT